MQYSTGIGHVQGQVRVTLPTDERFGGVREHRTTCERTIRQKLVAGSLVNNELCEYEYKYCNYNL